MEVSLPGEQVQPLPKMGNKNKKNNQKNKPNGFICFAQAQKSKLNSQYNIRGSQMLVELCDPLWRQLTPDEKKQWNFRAKDEHARSLGRKVTPGDGTLRMDCNRKYISERQNAEKAELQRREREIKLVQAELERCEEIIDKEFYIIDTLSIVEYLEGECVPCEIAVVKCTIRSGIMGYFHFFPDPGPLRPGHFAEALERCELEHEIKPKDFPLASKDYEGDVSKLVTLINGNSPKTPLLFARSSEAKKVESCLEWLGFRVNQEFKPKVMELESFVENLVKFTKNVSPSFAQIRRLLFETKFDFVQGNRCEFHSQTDKIACAIGNIRKYFYFMSEILYDYYEYDIIEGHHFPVGFDNSCAGSRAASTYSVASSVMGDRDHDFSDTMSVASSFSIGSYQHKRDVDPPRRPMHGTVSYSSNQKKKEVETPEILSQVSSYSVNSANSFATAASHMNSSSGNSFVAGASVYPAGRNTYASPAGNSFVSCASAPGAAPRRPNIPPKEITYDKPYDPPVKNAYTDDSSVNSFSTTPTAFRSLSPAPSLGRGIPSYPNTQPHSFTQPPHYPQPGGMIGSPTRSASDATSAIGRSRARGYVPQNQQRPVPGIGRGKGRGSTPSSTGVAPLPRKPNSFYEYGGKPSEK